VSRVVGSLGNVPIALPRRWASPTCSCSSSSLGGPDDVICFLTELVYFRLLVFVVVIATGRFPAYAVTSFTGDGLAPGNLVGAVIAVLMLVVFSVYAYAEARGDPTVRKQD